MAEFDEVAWWKRLLDQSDKKTKGQVTREIVVRLKSDSAETATNLQRIASWFQSEKQHQSQSVQQADLILRDFLIQTIASPPASRTPNWPSDDPIHVALADHKSESPLVSWLIRPSFTAQARVDRALWLKALIDGWLLGPFEQLNLGLASHTTRWKSDFKLLSEQFDLEKSRYADGLLPLALVAADYAVNTHGFTDPAAEQSIRGVLASVVKQIRERRIQAYLKAHWAQLRECLKQLSNVISETNRAHGAQLSQDDILRMKTQARSLEWLQGLFAAEIERFSSHQGGS